MREQKVSSRYASALMDIAIETKSIETVLSDLDFVISIIKDNKKLSALAYSPIIPDHKKQAVFEEIFTGKISKLSLKFILLVIDKNRTELIPDIRLEFISLYNIRFGRQPVIITSAIELSKDMSDRLIDKLSVKTGKTILPEFKTDKKIKGGLKIRIDDIIYDSSIQTQLKLLRNRLTAK